MTKIYQKSISAFILFSTLFLLPNKGESSNLKPGVYTSKQKMKDGTPKTILKVGNNNKIDVYFHKGLEVIRGSGMLDKTGTSATLHHACTQKCPQQIADKSEMILLSEPGLKISFSWTDPQTGKQSELHDYFALADDADLS